MAKKIMVNFNPHPRPQAKCQRIKVRFLAAVLAFTGTFFLAQASPQTASAADCPDVKLLFARGSGETQDLGGSFLALNAALGSKLSATDLSYRSEDLLYPAPAVGFASTKDFLVTLGAYVSGGESFEFGRSVALGTRRLVAKVNSDTCPNTKYLLAGYSQGAMVLDRALPQLKAERVLYAATFGDPKIYLPEGEGSSPAACRGENLSEYRAYVPDCHAYRGILGAQNPYHPESFAGRVGTWCNNHDVLCSSYVSFKDHEQYVADNLYEDAARVMFDKVRQHFGLDTGATSPHDTAILIDSTSSMTNLIDKYKAEALRLARETLESGGRVALYDYRDLKDPYQPVEYCSFADCDLEKFERELSSIKTHGGGDTPESLLSASLHAMKALEWQRGATKSLVVLTDANFLAPDRDGATLDEVIATSKKIDPVNFYIITTPNQAEAYTELATRTDGKVVTNLNELSLLTDYIMDRYDSLPRVEETDESLELPTLAITSVEPIENGTAARIHYTMSSAKALVILNDTILGVTDQTTFTLTDLQPAYKNTVTLVPITDELRGLPVSARINEGLDPYDDTATPGMGGTEAVATPTLPKAPDTGAPRTNP